LVIESVVKMKRCSRPRRTFVGYVLSVLVSLVVLARGSVPTLEELSSGLFDSISFNVSHLTLDSETGRLYVGAVNRLYELSPALDQLREVVTGPYPDNPMCPPPPEPCRCTVISCRGRSERVPIDGVTKTLLIDYNARQLIHCTNLFQVNHPTAFLADRTAIGGDPVGVLGSWPPFFLAVGIKTCTDFHFLVSRCYT